MKKIFIQLVFIFSCATGMAQTGATGNIYEDAFKVYNAVMNNSKASEALSVIAYYFNNTAVTSATVAGVVTPNPFLNPYGARLAAAAALTNPLPTAGGAAGLLGMNVAKYADGLAKFLIERGKQELSMAFFDRFRKDLDKFPELKFLFVKSNEIVQDIESHNINSVLQELRDAFIKDLTNMPENILSMRSMAGATVCPAGNATCITRVNNIAGALSSGAGLGFDHRFFIFPLRTAQGIIDGNNIIEILNKIANDQSICSVNDDLNSAVKLIALLTDAFRTNDNNSDAGIFISQSKFNTLFGSADFLQIFLGLAYQKYNDPNNTCYRLVSISGQNLQTIFTNIITNRLKFHTLLTSFDKVNFAYASIKKQLNAGEKPDFSNFAAVSVASISAIKDFTESIYAVLGLAIPATYSRLFANLSIASDFCADIQQRNYSGVFNDVIRFFQSNTIVTNDTRDKIVKYLSFAANLASASNSDEVKDAINSVALPPGSYSIKQKSAFNISVNAYVGYAWDLNGGLYARGVYAPFGFAFSAGLGKRNGGSLSIFTSVVDVGALVSYRLKQGNTEELKQEVRLESIISPSAQLMIGIPRVPLTICAGWRLTPKLFYETTTGFDVVKSKSVFNTGILIDIPVFTIFNKPYN